MAVFRFDPTSLSRYGRLVLLARGIVEGFLAGLHKSPFKGYTVEFAEHREYFLGDDLRHIDWRAFGKTDRYFIKEFEAETNVPTYLVLDASGSMGFGDKFVYSQHLVAALAYLLLRQRDAVGLVAHDARLRAWLPAFSRSKHLLRIGNALEALSPAGETSLGNMWEEVARRLQRRGLVLLISDCFDDAEPLLKGLQALRHRHDVLLYHIMAPEELDFPFQSASRFQCLERGGHEIVVEPQHLRATYNANVESFCRRLVAQSRRSGVDYQLMRTDEPVDRALARTLHKRQQLG